MCISACSLMEKAKGKVKHVVLVKFKDEASGEQIEQIIKDYTSLVNLIEPIKSLEWYLHFSRLLIMLPYY